MKKSLAHGLDHGGKAAILNFAGVLGSRSTKNQLSLNATIYKPLERFFNTDQLLTKDHTLKMPTF